eukprot:TRINITY_DN9388_c0_g3_i4.p1 TRINITY_DN9388_c0_g3~~TRINITY_DN9388_c0_g3_i4.p1  ORF type:complete len:245 (-),score=31.63 TRINITY_DN9388_c0_g3_i4:92-826(-)
MTLKGSFRICPSTCFTPAYTSYKSCWSFGGNMREDSSVFRLVRVKSKWRPSSTGVFTDKEIDECIRTQIKMAKRQNVISFSRLKDRGNFLKLKDQINLADNVKKSRTRMERNRFGFTTIGICNIFNEVKGEFQKANMNQTLSSVTHMLKQHGTNAIPAVANPKNLQISGTSIKPFNNKLTLSISKEAFQHIARLVNEMHAYSLPKPYITKEKAVSGPVIFIRKKRNKVRSKSECKKRVLAWDKK